MIHDYMTQIMPQYFTRIGEGWHCRHDEERKC